MDREGVVYDVRRPPLDRMLGADMNRSTKEERTR